MCHLADEYKTISMKWELQPNYECAYNEKKTTTRL